MNKDKSSVASATGLMVALNFLKPAIGIFLLPLYLNVLTGEEYGLYTLMVAFSGILNIVGTLRVNSAMIPFYFDFNHDRSALREYLRQLFSFSTLLGTFCFLFVFLLGPNLFDLLFKDESITFLPYGAIVSASGLLNAINSVYYIYLKNEKNFKHLSWIIFLQIIGAVVIQVVLILGYKLGVYGLLLGIMVPYLLTFFYIIFKEKDILTLRLNSKLLTPSLKYSIALIPFLLIYWLSSTGDRIVLEQFIDLKSVGQYALLMVIAGVMFLVADSIMNGIRPFLYEAFQQGVEAKRAYILKMIKFYLAANIITVGGILFIGHNLNLITSEPSFLEVIPYFTMGATIVFLRSYLLLFNMQLNYNKNSREISLLSMLSLLVLLGLYYFWSQRWGLEGVLYAGLVAGLFTAIIFFILAQGKFKIKYNLIDLWLIPIIVFVINFCLAYLSGLSNFWIGGLQLLTCLVASYFILKGNFMDIFALVKNKEFTIGKKGT